MTDNITDKEKLEIMQSIYDVLAGSEPAQPGKYDADLAILSAAIEKQRAEAAADDLDEQTIIDNRFL